MLANSSLDQKLMRARSHVKSGNVAKDQKLHQNDAETLFSQAKDEQQGLANFNKPKQNNPLQIPPQEVVDQLVNLYNQGEFSSVVEQAQVLTNEYPNTLMIWNILGASAAQIGMSDQAVIAFKKVISFNPDYAEAYSNMGFSLYNQGKLDQAMEAYKKAISLKPDYTNAYFNMGNTLKDQGKFEKAIKTYKKALSLNPNHALAYNNMGIALKDQGKVEEAIDAFQKSISLKPDYVLAYNNMGIVLLNNGKFDQAIIAYNKAFSLNPDYAEAYNNMGIALKDQGKLNEAIDAYNKALSLKPNNIEAHINLGFALLNSGKLKKGLDENEWRWKSVEGLKQMRHFSQPLWDGKKSLNGKRILLWAEQGIADVLHWSSCLPFLSSQAEHCILECHKKLIPLLERSFPNVEVKAINRSIDLERDDFDFHLPMGSLYRHFIQEISQNAKPISILIPDPSRVKYWKKRLNALGTGPYIGVSWKSSILSAYRSQHYPPIPEWTPIFTIPDVTFINLQYKDFSDDLTKIKDNIGVTVHNFNDLDHFDDIDEVAALSAALDMVVSVKNSVLFTSAGVGTTTILTNWRQSSFSNIYYTPITSSLKIFERDTWEPWENVFNLIAEDIFKLKNKISYSKDKL